MVTSNPTFAFEYYQLACRTHISKWEGGRVVIMASISPNRYLMKRVHSMLSWCSSVLWKWGIYRYYIEGGKWLKELNRCVDANLTATARHEWDCGLLSVRDPSRPPLQSSPEFYIRNRIHITVLHHDAQCLPIIVLLGQHYTLHWPWLSVLYNQHLIDIGCK